MTAVITPGLAATCTAGNGEVWIAPEEAERIAAHLGLSLQRFFQRYTRATSKVAGFKQLKAKKNPVSPQQLPWPLQAASCAFTPESHVLFKGLHGSGCGGGVGVQPLGCRKAGVQANLESSTQAGMSKWMASCCMPPRGPQVLSRTWLCKPGGQAQHTAESTAGCRDCCCGRAADSGLHLPAA